METDMSIEKVRAYLRPLGLEDRIQEFDVSSATVELAAAALGVLIVNKRRRRGRETLFVNRKAAMEAAEPIQEQEDTAK